MEEKFEKIHSHINELLKFAEAKNAGLLAFNGIVLLEAFKNIYEHDKTMENWQLAVFGYIVILNLISFLICLSAIFPSRQTKIFKHTKRNQINLLYYGTIATSTPVEYIEQFQKKYEITAKNKVFCIDLIRQIIIQSQILITKFKKFKLASLMSFCAFASPIGYIVYKFWIDKENED